MKFALKKKKCECLKKRKKRKVGMSVLCFVKGIFKKKKKEREERLEEK